MRTSVCFLCLSVVALMLSSCAKRSPERAEWHHPLYLGNHDYWRQRVPIVVKNDSALDLVAAPVRLAVGSGVDEVPLAGVAAESVRLVNAEGDQVMLRVNAPDGTLLEQGVIPAGSTLTLPNDAPAGGEQRYFLYFENPSAWPVGEYFYTHGEVANGGFEQSGRYGPLGWELEWREDARDVVWSEAVKHSGERSLEIVANAAGEEAEYGAIQENLYLIPGATYTIEAWFRSAGLEGGAAGLELVPANLERTKRNAVFENLRLVAPANADDWQRASLEFSAPEGANVLHIRTFIEGTGRFWVDDVRLTGKTPLALTASVLAKESAAVAEIGRTDEWYGGTANNPRAWPVRAAITVPNFTDTHLADRPVYVDILQLKNRLYAEIDDGTAMQVTDGTRAIPYLKMGDAILFKQDIPASTVRTFYIYFAGKDAGQPQTYSALSEVAANLVADSDFERAALADWQRFGESEHKTIAVEEDEAGNSVARLAYSSAGEEAGHVVADIEVRHADASAALGLYQVFEVEPGATYFCSAQVRCSNVLDRTKTLRVRFFDADGKETGGEKSLNANPDMFQNMQWVLDSMIFHAPTDAHTVQLELLNTVDGDVWYDDVFLMKIGEGDTGALAVERLAERELSGLAVWSQNPLERVFPDDLPRGEADAISMSAAQHDAEAWQIVLRSPTALDDIQVRVTPPSNAEGAVLDRVEVGVVGYVRINFPSNYIRDFVTPFWRTKLPKGKVGSDGWAGWWADPILPFDHFDLPANTTKAVWVEVAVPAGQAAGEYTGSIELVQNGSVLRTLPLNFQVYDFTLPETPTVKATYVPRFNEREMFGRETTEDEKREGIWRYMAEHKISPEMIRPQPRLYYDENGEPRLDFTEFDKAGEKYFGEMKFAATWSPRDLFYLFGWGHPPREKFGEKPYPGEPPYEGVDRSQLRPEFKRKYQSVLRQYWEHMKEKGWADTLAVYISDEPHDDPDMVAQMKAVCDMIHEVDPAIRIYVSTWWYRPEFEGYVNVWGVSHRGGGWGHPVPAEHLREITKNGGTVFFTTDGMQCTDTPFLGFERMLPYFCFKYEASEYEFWASNWHTLDPYTYGWHRFHRQSPSAGVWYWMRYPNGDGTMIYPGPPIGVENYVASVRLKQAREGVEDHAFMTILKQLIETRRGEGADTSRAEAVLERARDLVTIPCADGRYTTDYTPDPALLMEIRHEVASAIEALSR